MLPFLHVHHVANYLLLTMTSQSASTMNSWVQNLKKPTRKHAKSYKLKILPKINEPTNIELFSFFHPPASKPFPIPESQGLRTLGVCSTGI